MSKSLDWSRAAAPSLDDFADLAQAAFDQLPQPFRALCGEVGFRISDFAEPEVLQELEIEDPFELSGIYDGVAIPHRSVMDSGRRASQVFLYRRPILDEWAERGDVTLGELITHILVHEIGHHFGLSDEDMHAIEAR